MKKIYFVIIAVFALTMTSCNSNSSNDELYADVHAAQLQIQVMMSDLSNSFKTKKYTDVEIEKSVDSIISQSFDELIAKYGEEAVVNALNEIYGSDKIGDKILSMEQVRLMGKLMAKKEYRYYK